MARPGPFRQYWQYYILLADELPSDGFYGRPLPYETANAPYYHYFDDLERSPATSREHLLKHTARIPGLVHERLDIIFIDPHHITRPVPLHHQLIDRERVTFPITLRPGLTTF